MFTNPFDTDLDFTPYERDRVLQFKDENKLDELFRALFIKQCNKLHEILPELFEATQRLYRAAADHFVHRQGRRGLSPDP